MNKTLPLYCLLATLLFTTTLPAQTTNPFFRHIPPDAEQVFHLNLSALGSKISWDEISGMIPAPKGQSEEMMKYIKDPSLSGIDFHQGLISAISHVGKNADSPSYVTAIFALSDSGKLLPLIRGAEKGLRTFRFPGKGMAIGKDKMAIAWNDKMLVMTVIDPVSKKIKTSPADKSKPGAPKKVVSPYYTMLAAKKSAEALEGFSNSPYTTNPDFVNGFSDDADFHMWSSPGSLFYQLMEMTRKKNPLANAGLNIPRPKTNMHMLTTFRFDVGKITLRTSTIVPPDSAKIYSIFNSRPLNPDLITHLPGKAVLGMVNVHMAPSAMNDLLEHYHTKYKFDSLMAKNGLSTDDFTKALKGDFLFAGMEPNEKPDTGGVKPDIYFVTTIADMGAFLKIAGKLGVNKDSSGGVLEKMKAGFTLRDNTLVIGPKGKTDAFFNTNNPANLNPVSERVRDNAFSVVLDIKAISSLIKASNNEPSRKTQQALHFIDALDRLTYAAGNYKDGRTEYYFELKMANSSENSLRSLFNLLH